MLNQKRADLVVEEVKRWIDGKSLQPGDRLPKEGELQRLFAVSKGTTREALKSLEVQGLVTINTGPSGGATVMEVPLDRTFQFVQNYLYFKDVSVDDIYAVRRITEPELAAGAVPNLGKSDLRALERSIEICTPLAQTGPGALEQRQEDLRFHDILARANPNPFLRFLSEMINELLRQVVMFEGKATRHRYQRFGRANLQAHGAITAAARDKDAGKVRQMMLDHIIDAEKHVRKLRGALKQKLVLDSDARVRIALRREDA